ncbi:MAG: hypothetical protein WC464_03305 [Bdellovibrionales bacterium]
MLDVAWPEVFVVGAVALVAIGPKDMPKVMHALGRWTRKARLFVRDFARAFEQISHEAELNEKIEKLKFPPSGGE